MGYDQRSAFSEDDSSNAMSDINVTPLVDVVLVLLIMFMIIVPAMFATSPIKVELSAAIAGTASEHDDIPKLLPDIWPLAFTLRQEKGTAVLYLDSQPIEIDSLRIVLEKIQANGTEPSASFSADSGISYGEVVRHIDLLVSLGLKELAIDTYVHR